MMPMLFLDTEFNGFRGELISLALYDPDGESFYEVAESAMVADPWVSEHVIPFLGKEAIGRPAFNAALRGYLLKINEPYIVADWPADFEHLFHSLIVDGHWTVDIPMTVRLLESGPLQSAIPHNALEDAKALYHWYYTDRVVQEAA